MKEIAKVLGFCLFILLILYLLALIREGPPRSTYSGPVSTPTPYVPLTPTPIPVYTAPPPTPDTAYQQTFQQTQQQRAAQAAAGFGAESSGIRQQLEIVARETNVRITGYTERGRAVTVTVAGPSHVEPGNFIDGVARRGWVRDFQLTGSNGGYTADQRRFFQSTFQFNYEGPL